MAWTNSNSFTSFSVLWFIRKQAKVVYMHLTMKLVSINLFILHNLYSFHSWILNFFHPSPRLSANKVCSWDRGVWTEGGNHGNKHPTRWSSGISKLILTLTPKILLSILPSSCYTFPCKLVTRIWHLVKITALYLMFEYSHDLFVGKCMDVIGRSNMLITSGS